MKRVFTTKGQWERNEESLKKKSLTSKLDSEMREAGTKQTKNAYITTWVMVKFCLANFDLGLWQKGFFIYMQGQKCKKEVILKFKIIFRIIFVFKALTVHELWPVSIFIVMTSNEKRVTVEISQTVCKTWFLISLQQKMYF